MYDFVSSEVSEKKRRLVREIERLDAMELDWLRKQIVEKRRLDILAEVVLGLELAKMHKAMQRHILRHPWSLQLAFRGAGKTTTVTVTYAIWRIICDRNIRILIVSKTHGFAKAILKEIVGHLENNELLIKLFGEFKGDVWHKTAIEVSGRSRPMKEATITTAGADTQVVGGHYEVILADDLVDEKNARTRHMRELLRTFVNKSLIPTLEPTGELHFLGTRYHYDDYYGEFQAEYPEATQIIRSEDETGRSPWPAKFSSDYFRKLKKSLGIIAYNSQFLCDTEAMKGEVFEFDWMIPAELEEVPEKARIYMGADLAISEKESSDKFAVVVIAVHERHVWVLEHFEGHLKFHEQVNKLISLHKKYDPVRLGIEVNQYQDALRQELERRSMTIRCHRIRTSVDKMTRAIKLQAKFTNDEMHFCPGNGPLIDHLVAFSPNARYKDLFDALDFACTAAFRRRTRAGRGREGGGRREIPLL